MSLQFDEAYFTTKDEGMKDYQNFPHFKERANWIQQNLSGTILEIGCAFGFLINELDKLFIHANGLDSSSYALSQAPSEIADRLTLGNISDLNTSYDWIISWNVLDCFKDDADAVKCANILNQFSVNQLHIISTNEEQYIEQGYFIRDYSYWRSLLPTATIIEQTGKVHSPDSFSKIPLSFGGVSD